MVQYVENEFVEEEELKVAKRVPTVYIYIFLFYAK